MIWARIFAIHRVMVFMNQETMGVTVAALILAGATLLGRLRIACLQIVEFTAHFIDEF